MSCLSFSPAATPSPRLVRRAAPLLLGLAVALLGGCQSLRVDRAARVYTGFTSHVLCDDVFGSGLDARTAFDERVRPWPGLGALTPLLGWQLDTGRRELQVSLAGVFTSRARWRPGSGCTVWPAGEAAPEEPAGAAPEGPPADADPYGWTPPGPPAPALEAALRRAIPDANDDPRHRTKALVVVHRGRLVAERFAHGIGPDTPLLGFSATKSVMNLLAGRLVQLGRLRRDEPAALPAWAAAGDARGRITVEQLMRQTSGLVLPQDHSGFDIATQILYTAPDKVAAAAQAPLEAEPGSRWHYTDAHYALLAGVLQRAAGGAPGDLQRLARRELFEPIGLHSAVFDTDAAGTPIGASHLLASARDWARLGQFALDDGVVGGRRLLPEGWLRTSTTPTLATGYGMGWWTNRVAGRVPEWGVPWGLPSAPPDTFFARGFMGQFVVVIPSEQFVLVRLAVSHERGDDIGETDRIVAEVRAALGLEPAAPAAPMAQAR